MLNWYAKWIFFYTNYSIRFQGCLFYLPRIFWLVMEEDKLNSMIEGIKGGEKEAKKEEEKKNITGVLKDLGMQLGSI